jgi:c-di-GMP-binding flagellar brake protein YcgR
VLLAFPESLRSLQRRAVYRVVLPLENATSVRVWRVAEHAILRDRPMAAQEIPARLRDLSVMGMGVQLLSRDENPPRVSVNERLRIVLKFRDWEVLVEGRAIHQRPTGANTLCGGAAFKKLEKDFEGRQALAKLNSIVGQLQRDEIVRRRAG